MPNATIFQEMLIQHSHLVLTCFGLIVTFSTVSEPFLVYYIAPNSTWDEWFGLFIGHGIILIVCNFIFCLLIDARPAKFTEISAIPMK
uniref:7TM_GPCR_Srx domain-containing protein n=1 Tax=Heterorhabditis bacteriophora TaxID=37862 RepID=A0A1I7X891_HETBA